jgi:hypothetical protein
MSPSPSADKAMVKRMWSTSASIARLARKDPPSLCVALHGSKQTGQDNLLPTLPPIRQNLSPTQAHASAKLYMKEDTPARYDNTMRGAGRKSRLEQNTASCCVDAKRNWGSPDSIFNSVSHPIRIPVFLG